MAKIIYWNNKCKCLTINKVCELVFDVSWFYFPILKQLPDFSSCHVFGTYPGFETITGIHINVNFQTFT